MMGSARVLPGRSRLPATLAVAAVATVLFGFGIGFTLGSRPSGGSADLASGPASTAPGTTVVVTTSTETPTTVAVTTVLTTTSTRPPPTTPAPTTSTTVPAIAPPVIVTVPTTVRRAPPPTPLPTTPPTTLGRAPVEVSYVANLAGQLVIPKPGFAVLTLKNTGATTASFIIGDASRSTAPSQEWGLLEPGQVTTVRVATTPTAVAGTKGVISVKGAANPWVPFLIQSS